MRFKIEHNAIKDVSLCWDSWPCTEQQKLHFIVTKEIVILFVHIDQ